MNNQAAGALRFGVLGAGAWGTALAQTLARSGHLTLMWDRDPTVVADITRHHENRRRFPGLPLDMGISATNDLATLFSTCNTVVLALPSEATPVVTAKCHGLIDHNHILINASKGLRESDGALLSMVWAEVAPAAAQLVLTGPSFARELMEEKVTAVTLAGPAPIRRQVADAITAPYLRVYESEDIIGAQLGGALKNVLAIAAGILDGLELGHNARAALLTRGLAEMARYTAMLGGSERTIWGLAGMGDLLLTATSPLSRNYRFGQLIGRGDSVAEAQAKTGTVEGMATARIATVQAQANGVDLAVISAVDGILQGDVTPLRVVEYLMRRPRTQEEA